MPNNKYNIIEFLILDDYEFVVNAIKKIYKREPSQSEIDEYLYNLRTRQCNKINLLRLLIKSHEAVKNPPVVKGSFLFGALNRARKLPFVGILFKPLFYLIHIPVLINQTERNNLFFRENLRLLHDKIIEKDSFLSQLNSEFSENKQKLFDLYLHIGRISRYNKRLEKLIEKDINEIQKNREQYINLLEELKQNINTKIEHNQELYEQLLKNREQYINLLEESKQNINTKIELNQELYEQLLRDHSQVVHDLNFLKNDSNQKFQNLSDRAEFIREELLYEFKYAGRKRKKKAKIEIVNKKKFQQIKKDIKINVGCGHLPLEGYLNIDKRRLPNVDIVTDALNLPFDKSSITELYSSHLAEHFPEEEFKRVVLPYWHSLIKNDGILKLTFPDFETMAQKYIEKDYPFEKFRKVIFGAQDYDGDYHFNMYTKETISTLLYDIGFKKVEIPVVGRLNGDCYEMAIVATK
jgi:predicted SAM-dependent methyltransferase